MRNGMDTEYFAQHIQCTREAKSDCLPTVECLLELAFAARRSGLLKMEEMIQDKNHYSDAFLRKAVNLVIEVSNPDNIREVLYNYLFTSSNYVSNRHFLNNVLITETMLAVSKSEDLDYIFTYLVPSFFGFDYEDVVIDLYHRYRSDLAKKLT